MKKSNSILALRSNKTHDESTVVGAIASKLSEQLVKAGGSAFIDPMAAEKAFALESASELQRADLMQSVQQLEMAIKEAVGTTSGVYGEGAHIPKLSLAQEEAAVVAGFMGANLKKSFQKTPPTFEQLQGLASDNMKVVGNLATTEYIERRELATEAFDNQTNQQSLVFSVAYNLRAARQNEFGEAFYPTIVISPDNVGFMVSVNLMYVYDEVRRQISGELNKFNRKNVIRAQIDASILKNDQTKIVPYYRASGGNQNTQYFMTGATPYNVVIDGESIPTAPLGINKQFSLLGISQNNATLAGGQFDQTDAIGSSVRLSAIYVEVTADVGGTPTTEVIKFDTAMMNTTDFNANVQGNSRSLNLNAGLDGLLLSASTKKIDGAASTIFAQLNTNKLFISTRVFGNISQDKGDCLINAAPVAPARVLNSAGQEIDMTAGAGATAAGLVADATVIGYDLIAYRTNSNRRQRGQLVDTQVMNYLYTVPLLPPITALRPVGESDVNDSHLLSTLVNTTYQRTSNAAVTTLIETKNFLSQYVGSTTIGDEDAPNILGVARHLVKAAYDSATLDAQTAIDSLTSLQRADDVSALLINAIRDMAYRLWNDSGLKAAMDHVYDGAAPKPLVIVGTDPVIARYLTLTGDLRTLGDRFDVKVVETLDSRVTGQIFIGFGTEQSFNSGVASPLHNGNMAWKPELTVSLPITRNGAISHELTVYPSFRHVQNLPVLGHITVTNIENVIASKVTVNTSN